MNLKYVEVDNDNLELAVKIQNAIFPDEDGRQNYIEGITNDPYRKEMVNYIVYNEEIPIGVVGLYSYNEYPESAWLSWFGVLEEYRNNGYASSIFDFFEDIAKSKGYKSIRVYTDDSFNKALLLYEKKGMVKEYYSNELESDFINETTIIYSKSLTKEKVDNWNNKFLGLTAQSEKESGNYLDIIKQKIISDTEYQKWMKEIANYEGSFANSSEFNNQIALDHGIEHMNRVAMNVYKLMQEYGCDSTSCDLGYIAGLIHDIGIINGKKNHAQNGSLMVRPFLKRLDILSDVEIEKIEYAVAHHGSGENTDNEIALFLAIADKIDMCKARSLGNSSPIQEIESYHTTISHNTLNIYYELSSLKGLEGLYIIPKSIDVPKNIANKLGMQIKFYINNQEEDFASRYNYTG